MNVERRKTKVKVKGVIYEVVQSRRKGKEYMVSGPGIKGAVHFGDPKMPEYPGTKRGNSYCARSSGIKGVADINTANYWSRKLWSCRGKKSISRKKYLK